MAKNDRISFSIPPADHENVERAVDELNTSRGGLIRLALNSFLNDFNVLPDDHHGVSLTIDDRMVRREIVRILRANNGAVDGWDDLKTQLMHGTTGDSQDKGVLGLANDEVSRLLKQGAIDEDRVAGTYELVEENLGTPSDGGE